LIILNYLDGFIELTEEQKLKADVNSDKVLNNSDFENILYCLSKDFDNVSSEFLLSCQLLLQEE